MYGKLLSLVLLVSAPVGLTQAACNVADAAGADIYDARVFNWHYYVNQNADLLQAGITSTTAIRNHWKNYGLCEGRIAHPDFHSVQYLNLYADLRTAFGNNYAKALRHYIINGIGEGRRGYDANAASGTYGRWVARNDIISVSTSPRVAGAVDSVFWGGREFINSYDHGRQLQPALSKNGHGECFNPTLAGNRADGVRTTTTSVLEGAWASGSAMATQTLPAFWLEPFTTDWCGPVINTTRLSNYRINTHLQVGLSGMRHAIRFQTQVYVPEAVNSLVIEAPTGYLAGDFTAFYTYDVVTQALTPLSASLPAGEQGKPLVLSTPSGSHAMGVWSPGLPHIPNIGYGQFRFPGGTESQATMKWNAVYRTGAVAAGTYLHYTSYVAVGSRENVRVTLAQLYAAWRNGQL
ncbi:MAG: hypothetical protein E6Q88_09985 [Lysobacteraceae bacterium]|nr:MAG: hypothetical protein E6Q88_09985 [Xanthomonadaceae bacterium]